MEKIRIGVVGSGGMAASRMASFSRLDECELVALAARNPQTGPPLAQRYEVSLHTDWRDLVARKDLDAVLVLTHNESHGPIALGAMETGKHVFMEYPLARRLEEGERLVDRAESTGCVLRLTHNEPLSAAHRMLKQEVSTLGQLLTAIFVRLTPGRGGRPEILFNLNISGPPVLFFIYHIYPLVDLFGPAEWVEGHAEYVGMKLSGQYERFVNTVSVGFTQGGLGNWTWAGGIAIQAAEEFQRFLLVEGTLIRQGGRWCRSNSEGLEELEVPDEETGRSLEKLFLNEVNGKETLWREDMGRALDAIRISLAAETSVREGRRVQVRENEK